MKLMVGAEKISWDEAKARWIDMGGTPSDEQVYSDIFGEDTFTLHKRSVPLPDEYKPLIGSNSPIAIKAIEYLRQRRVTLKQITDHQMGYCYGGEYKNRIIIPVYNSNNLMFWVARAIGNPTGLKEKSPTNSPYQWSKSEVIFNLDRAATNSDYIVISEGIFDALSWGIAGVSLLGKVLYEQQLSQLVLYRKQLETVYIALDADARPYAMKAARQLSSYFNVMLVNIPEEYNDPNGYLQAHKRSEMLTLLDTAEDYYEQPPLLLEDTFRPQRWRTPNATDIQALLEKV